MHIGQQLHTGPGRGTRRRGWVQMSARFDVDTFEQVRAVAIKQNCSLMDAVRYLVEAGLDSEEEHRS
ncbi:MAG: hypothetical protein AAGF30_00445 [Pseudomonadota bacterium]